MEVSLQDQLIRSGKEKTPSVEGKEKSKRKVKVVSLKNLSDDTGTDGSTTLTDGETKTLSHGNRSDKLNI